VNRGDVYWHIFRAPDKRRPVVILTQDRAIPYLNALAVAAVTTKVKNVPSQVLLESEDGMPELCAVNLHQIQLVRKSDLKHIITRLRVERMREIREAAIYALGLEDPDEFAR